MSSFFDPPPPPSAPPGPAFFPRQPPWAAPPVNVFGELVRDREVLFRSPSLTVSLDHLRAYPEGFEFRIGVRSRVVPLGSAPPGSVRFGPRGPMMGPPRPYFSGEDQVRVGLAFADGARLTNLAPVVGAGTDDPPQPPLLAQLWAGGVGGRWDQRYWVWGLPPTGPLVVVVESPSREIPETRVEMPSAEILTAARRAETLWDEEGVTSGGVGYPLGPPTIFAPEPKPTGRRPADKAAAKREIEVAFAWTQEIQDDELVNVEGGEHLATTVRDLQRRFPGTAQTAIHHVEGVTFLSPTEASVWFSTWLGPSPYMPTHRGAAVVEDGRWKMSRATFCALLARVGIPCPPT